MRHILIFILSFVWTVSYGQRKNIVGTFTTGIAVPMFSVTFNADSTFEYRSTEHPTFYRWENFSEKGKWTVSADTIILNPQLIAKPFVESDFQEQQAKEDSALLLTFNHIKRYFNSDGNLIKIDTVHIEQLDYSFNSFKKKNRTRVTQHRSSRCTFAGYIPKEIITTNRTISLTKPVKELSSIFIGCCELQGTKKFIIKNPNSNHLILNVYSNYYQDVQIRQKRFLIKNENVIYTRQKPNGQFEKGDIYSRLNRQKGSS